MTDSELALLLKHCDGLTTLEEARAINQILRSQPAAREMLQSLSLQTVGMGEMGAARALMQPTRPGPMAAPFRSTGWWPWPAAAAALTFLLAGSAWWTHRTGEIAAVAPELHGPPVVTLTEASGTVWFRAASSVDLQPVERGMPLPTGVLLTEGSLSAALVKFPDGSEVALSADTELSFAETDYKSLMVRSGVISAQVQPQPAGRPMRVRTATAELQVIGTIFSVTAEEERTRLDVEKGEVKMTRLADGQSVDVRQDFFATAMATATGNLKHSARAATPSAAWQADFSQGLPPGWKVGQRAVEPGQTGHPPAFVRAEIEPSPVIDGKATRQPNHTIGTTNAWELNNSVLTELHSGSILRMKLRKARAGSLHVFACVRSLDGDRTSLGTDVLVFDNPAGWEALAPGEWGEVTARLDAPSRPAAGHTTHARSKGVFYIAISTWSSDLGLEMQHIRLE